MSTNTPDSWVVVRLTTSRTSIDKVLAGWYGGYLDGDSWKLSSGIMSTEEFDDRYEFTNHSGSVYVCYKSRERMSGIMAMQYSYYEEMFAKHNTEHEAGAAIEVVPYNQ